MDNEYIIFLLNTLGQSYIANDKFINNETLIDNNSKNFERLIKNAIKDKDYYIIDTYIVKFSIEFLLDIAQFKVKYNTINLKLHSNIIDDDKIYDWYNNRNYIIDDIKPYITINNPYHEVTLSSKVKKSSLTIEDILLASRYLTIYGDQSMVDLDYRGYTILSNIRNVILILSPGFKY